VKKVKTGVVGCGKVGRIHANNLTKISESNFTAVCDMDIERAKSFAKDYNVKSYSDVDEMIKDSSVEAIVVCTPHPIHVEPTIKACEAGVHVIVEKPLASSLKDCDDMIKAANDAGIRLACISQRRLYEPVKRVKKAIDSGKIGRPVFGTVNMLGWRDKVYYDSDPWRGTWNGEGGGVLVNQAPHQLDILQWLMGPINELFGVWDNLNHPYIEVEDTALAIIHFKNEGIGSIIVSNSQKPGIYGKVHIHGENGASVGVQTDGGAMFIAGMTNIADPPINDLWTIPGEEDKLSKWQEDDRKFFKEINANEYYHQLQVQDFLKSIIEDVKPMVTGEEGRKTVEIFTGIYLSKKLNKPVKFPLNANNAGEDYHGVHI
jgi:UDP-N-acetyl-2-amino-2-deoxyglucuronate dehydrogenase